MNTNSPHESKLPRGTKIKHNIQVIEARIAFLRRGTTLSRWARQNGILPQYMFLTLHGMRHGPRAREIISKLESALAEKVQ